MNKYKTGKFIRERREKINLTQTQLAQKLLTSRENVSKWERGVAIPNTEYLKQLCEILDCSVVDLLAAGEENRTADSLIYELLDKHIIFIKKVMYVIAALIVVFSVNFLAFYFFQNFNSVRLYRINGEKNNYELNDSIMFLNKDRCYLVFNGFVTPNNEEIKEIIIYYEDMSDEENIIYKSDEMPTLIVCKMKKEKLEKVLDDLHMQIRTDKNLVLLDLNVDLEYKNNKVFNDERNYVNEGRNLNDDLPSFIDDNFVYDYKQDCYIYEYEEGKVKTKIMYYPKTDTISIKEDSDMLIYYGSYSSNVSYMIDDEMFNYDKNKNICVSENCDEAKSKMIGELVNKYRKYLDY